MDKIRILLVEHNDGLRRTLAAYLNQKAEFSVAAEASNGAAALLLLENNRVDLVITCILMPIMDGFSMLEKLQKMNLDPKPKVIVLSAFIKKGFMEKVYALGASGYLLKPVCPERLCASIKDSFGKARLY